LLLICEIKGIGLVLAVVNWVVLLELLLMGLLLLRVNLLMNSDNDALVSILDYLVNLLV
jgi:hypothetical protein